MTGRITKPFKNFFRHESSSGAILIICSFAAILLANSPYAAGYEQLINHKITIGYGNLSISSSLTHLVNDGLMSVFSF